MRPFFCMDCACITRGELLFARTGAWHAVGSVGWGELLFGRTGAVPCGWVVVDVIGNHDVLLGASDDGFVIISMPDAHADLS